MERAPYAALAGRIQVRVQLKPVLERERFAQLIQDSLKSAGCSNTLLSDSGLEILRRLFGVAQLPITCSLDRKPHWSSIAQSWLS